MKHEILTLVALVLLSTCGWGESCRLDSLDTKQVQHPNKMIVRISGYVQGRVLGFFLYKGMTKEQVLSILGGNYWILLIPLTDGSVTAVHVYLNYGLQVSYSPDNSGIHRVNDLTFWPLDR